METFEIRIVDINKMPEKIRNSVIEQVAEQPKDFQSKFKGCAKITFTTNSPKQVHSIEPIEGTISDYFDSINKDGVEIPVF